jgi:hypothetical protein
MAGGQPNPEAVAPPVQGGEQRIDQSPPTQTVEQGAHERMLADSQTPTNGNGAKTTEVASSRPEQPAPAQSNNDNVKSMQVMADGSTRLEMKDRSVLVSKDGVPQRFTSPDGKTTEFEWRNGKLASIKEADGTSWRFENGKWAHYGKNGTADGQIRESLDILRLGGERGVATKGEITAEMVRNMRVPNVDSDTAARPGNERATAPEGEAPTFRVSTTASSPETLMRAAHTLRDKMSDRHLVEATILSFPKGERELLAKSYKELTGKDLKETLKQNRLESAAALLEPNQDASERAWLKENLDKLKTLPPNSETRDVIEMSVRNQLRSLTSDQLKTLNDELKAKDGKELKDVIKESGLSKPTKDILEFYQKGSENLKESDRRDIASISLNAEGLSSNARLLMFKEAFGGNHEDAQRMRQEFLRNGGEAKLRNVFRDSLDAREALDVAQKGKVHIATMIDRQKSNYGNNDAGIEGVVKNFMTDADRQMFKKGMALADKSPPPSEGTPDREAYDYYKRTHESLENASHLRLSMRVVSDDNRRKMVNIWEDIAMNGEETLLGRLAKTKNEWLYGLETNKTVLEAIRNFTEKDFELMKDPAYRKRVFDLVGGPEVGKPRNSIFPDDRVSKNAQEELTKIFGAPDFEEARRLGRPSLKQLATGYSPDSKPDNADILSVLGKSKPSEWTDLGKEPGGQRLQQTIEARIRNMPSGPREAAQRMLEQLKRGEEPKPTLTDRVYEDSLRGTLPKDIVRNLLSNARDGNEQITNNPELDKALKYSLSGHYDRWGKPLIEGKGLPISALHDLNWQHTFTDAVAAVGGMPTGRNGPGHLDSENFFKDLKFASPAERQKLVDAYGKNDPASKELIDKSFDGLTDHQREIAINVLKHPEQKMTLADRTRSALVGDGKLDDVLGELGKLNQQQKIELMNEYHQKYKTFMVEDLMRKADDNQRRQIEATLPENLREAYRVQMDHAAEQSRGSYGSSVPLEVAMRQTQDMIKLGLQRLPEADRQKYEQEIREAMRKYTRALKDNDQAKDQYAKDLVDKVTTVVSIVAAPYAVANLTRLAVTGVAMAGLRNVLEHNIKGEMKPGDVTLAAVLGAVDVMPGPGEFKALFAAVGKDAVKATLTKAGTHAVESLVSEQARERLGVKLGTAMEEAYKAKKSLSEEDVLKLVSEEVKDPSKAAELAKTLKGEVDNAIKKHEEELAKQTEQKLAEKPAGERPPQRVERPLERVGDEQVVRTAPTEATRSIEQLRGKFGPEADQTLNRIHDLAKRASELGSPVNPEHLKQLEALAKAAGSPEKGKLVLEVTERLLKANVGEPLGNDKLGLMAQIVQQGIESNGRNIPLGRILEPDNQVESLQLYLRGLKETSANAHSGLPVTARFGDRYEHHMSQVIEKALKDGNLRGGNWVFVPGEKGSVADSLGIDGVFIDLKNNKVVPFDVAAQAGKAQDKVNGVARELGGRERAPNPWVLPPADYDNLVKPVAQSTNPTPAQLDAIRNHLSNFLDGKETPSLNVKDFNLGPGTASGGRTFPSLGRSDRSGRDLTQFHFEMKQELGKVHQQLAAKLGKRAQDIEKQLDGEKDFDAALSRIGGSTLSSQERAELAQKLRVLTFLEDQAFHGRNARTTSDHFTRELTNRVTDSSNYRAAAGDASNNVKMTLERPRDDAGRAMEPYVKIDVASGRSGTFQMPDRNNTERVISEVHVYSGGAMMIVTKDVKTGVLNEPMYVGKIEEFVKHLEKNSNMDKDTLQRVAAELRQLSNLDLATRTPAGQIIRTTNDSAESLKTKIPGLTTLGHVLAQEPAEQARKATAAKNFLDAYGNHPEIKAMNDLQRQDLTRLVVTRGLGEHPIEDILRMRQITMLSAELSGKPERELAAVLKIEKMLGEGNRVNSNEMFNDYLGLAKAFRKKGIEMTPANVETARLMQMDRQKWTDRELEDLVERVQRESTGRR